MTNEAAAANNTQAGDNTAPPVSAPAASPANGHQPKPQGEKKEKKKKNNNEGGGSNNPLEVQPPPEFFKSRIEMFDRLYKEQQDKIASMPKEPIEITLPSGDKKSATSWETTPFEIAVGISKGLSEKIVIAKVDGTLWDLHRPLEKSAKLELLDFEHPEGKAVFWHSSAHVLGEAAEKHYGCHLCLGPPTDEGFFYEMELPEQKPVHSTDFPSLETLAKAATKEKQSFQRLVMKKEDLLEMFKYNHFKVHMISTKIPDGGSSTVYRCGPMIDFCVGPHIPHTGKIKAFSVTKNSASYFLNDANNASLQRIYGISFPDTKQMTEYKKFIEEAAKRDHRKIGRDQDLFFSHPLSPGSMFWLPHGTRIYNTIVDFLKEEYRKRGYSEVITPNMYNSTLWKQSGHYAHYADNMFKFNVEKEEFALKPMNCPGHCLIFGSRDRSYRELPLRLADFGVLHRNEASGALSGLTRVRRFQQDDAHIFCTQDQLENEVSGVFDFLKFTYGLMGFEFRLELSTRPEKYLGAIETWDQAEEMLKNALEKFVPGGWELNPGDGAFYGPKIDIKITDALRREHQCATIQLDYQLPNQFNLLYRASEGNNDDAEAARKRPVMIHRAIAGSIERFTAILTEHFGGKWPFWLSPRQVLVIPVAAKYKDYADEVSKHLWDAGIFSDADLTDFTLQKKIRNGEIAQYNFILVVGQSEFEQRSVNVRNRDDVGNKERNDKTVPLDVITQQLVALKNERRLKNSLE